MYIMTYNMPVAVCIWIRYMNTNDNFNLILLDIPPGQGFIGGFGSRTTTFHRKASLVVVWFKFGPNSDPAESKTE